MRDFVVLTINGQPTRIGGTLALMNLADYVRKHRRLTGTKIVCAEGDCGACTVLCLKPGPTKSFLPINACIAPVAKLDGAHVLTIEALKEQGLLSSVQKALIECHASQCGFCTPGFAMALTALFENSRETPDEQAIKNALTGNLCRCTGYQSIIDAASSLTKNSYSPLGSRFYSEELKQTSLEPILISEKSHEFFAPSSIKEACALLVSKPGLRIVGGATDLGVMHNKSKIDLKSVMSLHLIPGLDELRVIDDRVHVGALVSIARLRKFCLEKAPEFARFLNIFASPQIKNIATLVGNVANASPIADSVPFLMVADGLVHVEDMHNMRSIPMSKLYKGYKTLSLERSEIITSISFQIPTPSQLCRLYKRSQRKDLDIATINAAFLFELKEPVAIATIKSAKIAVGGVAPCVITLSNTEAFLQDKELNTRTIDEALALMQSEIKPLDDVRGSASLRRLLLDSVMRRFLHELQRSSHAHR